MEEQERTTRTTTLDLCLCPLKKLQWSTRSARVSGRRSTTASAPRNRLKGARERDAHVVKAAAALDPAVGQDAADGVEAGYSSEDCTRCCSGSMGRCSGRAARPAAARSLARLMVQAGLQRIRRDAQNSTLTRALQPSPSNSSSSCTALPRPPPLVGSLLQVIHAPRYRQQRCDD